MKHYLVILLLFMLPAIHTQAQHEHHNMPHKMTMPKKGNMHQNHTMNMDTMNHMDDDMSHEMLMPMNANTQHPDHAMKMDTMGHMDNNASHEMSMPMGNGMQHNNDSMDMNGMDHNHMGGDMSMMMSHAFSLNLLMTRNGSGTSWLPDASPMFGYMIHSKHWMYMIHGNIFIRYNHQDLTNKGNRGGEQWDAPNMLMFMGQRKVGMHGLFHFNTMFSFDNVVTGGNGYPLLFQSGETYAGQPLVDRQHPHDLFSELSVSYSHSFNENLDAFVYLGYPGEPAIGPVTFMHRPSGMDNPDAPLGHHWEDATHITFGVATVGIRYYQFKLEGSSFTGREPDENRYNFDKPRFDSRSVRLSFNPGGHWALQVSHAFIKSPEVLHPDDVYRTTASATYAYKIGNAAFFNATGLWGMNKSPNHEAEHAALLEASFREKRLVVYSRYEWVQKSTEELNLDESLYGSDHIFPVNAFTLGAGYDILQLKTFRTSAGAQFTLYHTDPLLNPLYGKNPMAAEVYLRFYPNLIQ